MKHGSQVRAASAALFPSPLPLITEAEALRSLVLEMGTVIRSLDENGEHSEFWTQDGGYIIDGRFPR